jgi:hypothetical protein
MSEPMPGTQPICDVCGKPATSSAVDVIRHEGGPYLRQSPTRIVKYGCDEHPAVSETHRSWST